MKIIKIPTKKVKKAVEIDSMAKGKKKRLP